MKDHGIHKGIAKSGETKSEAVVIKLGRIWPKKRSHDEEGSRECDFDNVG